MATAYPISAPVDFVNGSNTVLDFNAPAGDGQNLIRNFITKDAGDLILQTGATSELDRLSVPVDTTKTYHLSVPVGGGLPQWAAISSTGSFSAHVSASVAGITASNTWTTLSSTNVTWSTSSPSTDADSAFSATTGLFTVPETGKYAISAGTCFQANNTGNASTLTTAPTGRASRQARIYNVTSTTALSISIKQAEASSHNLTSVEIPTKLVTLTAGDTIALQVRHDATSAPSGLQIISTSAAPSCWFSVTRIS